MARHAKPHTHALARLYRGLWPDRNPLRRRSDRAEAAIMATLIAAFLSVAPFTALTVAGLAPAASGSPQTGQGQHRQAAGPAPTASHGSPPRAAVTSHGQSSGQRTGARQPRPPDLVAGLLLSMLAILVLATLVLGTGLAVHRVLLRRRLVAWGCDWAYFEPRWTQRR